MVENSRITFPVTSPLGIGVYPPVHRPIRCTLIYAFASMPLDWKGPHSIQKNQWIQHGKCQALADDTIFDVDPGAVGGIAIPEPKPE